MLRPMDYAEIFNEAFDLYKRNFALFAGIGAAVFVPYAMLSVFTIGSPINRLVDLGFYLPVVAASGAIVKALADRYLGFEATIAESWRYVGRRLGRYLSTSMLGGLLVLGGMILFCIPGLIVSFWLFFLWSVMVIEDRYSAEAIRRCRELARGQYRRILNVWALILFVNGGAFILTSIILAVPLWLGQSAAMASPALSGVVKLLQALTTAALQTVLTPFTSVLTVLFYFDVRVRKEGFDIELLAREMEENAVV